MISGIMAGVGGIVLAARLQSVNLNVGGGTLLLDSISAAVIGGVSLFGGRGEVRGALLGSLIIATIANGLNIGGYRTGTIYVVTGVILLAAVTLDTDRPQAAGALGPLVALSAQPMSTTWSAGTSRSRRVVPSGNRIVRRSTAAGRRARSGRADPRTRDS